MNYISPSSLQFYPATLYGTRLQIFTYGSLISSKHQSLLKPQKFFVSSSLSEQNPERKSNVLSTSNSDWEHNARSSLSSNGSSSNSDRSNWLDKWNEPDKRSRPKQPRDAVNYRRSRDSSGSLSNYGFVRNDEGNGSGGGGGTTMERIVEKLKKFGYMEDGNGGSGKIEKPMERVYEKGSVEDIFYMDEGWLPNARGSFSGEVELGGLSLLQSNGDVKFPWERTKGDGEEGKWSARSKSKVFIAESTLPESELRRLRLLNFKTKQKIRVKSGGVTQAIVDAIYEKWQTSEIVRLKIEGAAALNMKRMHEILERKTGGLVIWRSGTAVSLYRGVGYEDPSVKLNKRIFKKENVSSGSLEKPVARDRKNSLNDGTLGEVQTAETGTEDGSDEKKDTKSVPEIHYEDEVDKLLDGLGPRYEEWPGCEPLPVDADLLPGTIRGYQPPFRILPYGVRATLGQKEATSLRRLARVLPPHFALGRSRQLQGLAAAMIKLWERSLIAKIALKRGVQLTTSERMAEDLKKLTGGVLLSRNKDFLVFYRGKNFLSPEVTEALLERERLAKCLQDEEEQARMRASALFVPLAENADQPGNAGTLTETLDANAKWAKILDDRHREKVMREAEISRHANLVRKLEKKLALAERRLRRGERALSKVEESLQPTERQADPDSITDEERFMFRKLGLRMKAFLLLGRRGVFDGTVENMHLHWKHRELVKLIVKAQSFDQAKKIALALEAESGGVLVSVDKVSKGYAIIVFRGKDYQRPSTLRPKNLLTKRKALARSIELQRREALLKHVSVLQNRVETIRSEIEQMANIKDEGDEALYDRLDSAYPTDEEDSEEEGEGAYSETYDSQNDVENKSNVQTYEFPSETEYSYDLEDEKSEAESEDVI